MRQFVKKHRENCPQADWVRRRKRCANSFKNALVFICNYSNLNKLHLTEFLFIFLKYRIRILIKFLPRPSAKLWSASPKMTIHPTIAMSPWMCEWPCTWPCEWPWPPSTSKVDCFERPPFSERLRFYSPKSENLFRNEILAIDQKVSPLNATRREILYRTTSFIKFPFAETFAE